MKNMIQLIEKTPIIPAIKEEADIDIVCSNKANIVFVLYGDIMSLPLIVKKLKDANKKVFVNIDLIAGLSGKEVCIDYLKSHTQADGVISSKAPLLRHAKDVGLFTIHRFFIIDSFSYNSISKQLALSKADMLNILPGWPMIISWVVEEIKKPVIAGGLVCDTKTVNDCLNAGALSICSTNHAVWDLVK